MLRLDFQLFVHRRISILAGLLLCLTANAAPTPSQVKTSFSLSYGQSTDAWGTVSDIKGAQGDLDQMNSLLQKNYGTYEEAFSVMDLKVDGINGIEDAAFAKRLWLELSAEGDGYGLVRNPVVPELHASAILATIGAFGIQDDWFDSRVHSRFGILGGEGYEKRIDAFSTDLIDKLPVRSGHLSLYGMEQEFTGKAEAGDFVLKPRLYLHEIEFVTAVDPSALDVIRGNSYFAFRWKLQSDMMRALDFSFADRAQGGLVVVTGPQPLPIDLLPKVWDYSHRMQSFSEVGTMIGAGAKLDMKWGKSVTFDNVLGFFGGYWGGQTQLHLGRYHLEAGSWAIEASSAYQSLGQRIWTGGLGIGF